MSKVQRPGKETGTSFGSVPRCLSLKPTFHWHIKLKVIACVNCSALLKVVIKIALLSEKNKTMVMTFPVEIWVLNFFYRPLVFGS